MEADVSQAFIFVHLNHQRLKKILIADDEPDILEILQFNLQQEGYEVILASNGAEAVKQAKLSHPDLIILDVMMPVQNGISACLELRTKQEFNETLVVFLSAVNDEMTEVKALESGADDFISKPIRTKLLLTKIAALFRRNSKDAKDANTSGELIIDREKFVVSYNGNDVVLAKKEFELLALLASKPGKVFLRNEILSQIWGTEVIVGDRTIDVHIRKIRQKLDLDCITTVKGVGYKYDL